MPGQIVFVCTGNTCRSPMAEAYAKRWLEVNLPAGDIKVKSAGISAFPGSPASAQAVEVMKGDGIDIASYRSDVLTEHIIRESDLVLTMTPQHKQVLINLFPRQENILTLAEYAVGDQWGQVVDPFGQAVSTYRKCADQIKNLVEKAMEKYCEKFPEF